MCGLVKEENDEYYILTLCPAHEIELHLWCIQRIGIEQ